MAGIKKIDQELLRICNMAFDGTCLERYWGYCPHSHADDKCGLCILEYITEKLGYHK